MLPIVTNNTECTKCPLATLRSKVVNGRGNHKAKIVLITEWPGSPEDSSGDIFSGPIWEETKKLLTKAGIAHSEIFLTSTVRCIPKAPPPQKIRRCTNAEISACGDYLDTEIFTINPTVIVPMGTEALKRILGHPATIGNFRGAELWSDKYDCKVMPIYNPMVIRRFPEYEEFTILDLQRIWKSSQYPHLTPKGLGEYKTLTTIEDVEAVKDLLVHSNVFSYDTETTGLDFTTAKILCVSFSWAEKQGVTIPLTKYIQKKETIIEMVPKSIRKKNKSTGLMGVVGTKEVPKEKEIITEQYEPFWGDAQPKVIQFLKEIFSSPAIKVAHNEKFDRKILRSTLNLEVTGRRFDTLLAHFILHDNWEGLHGLKDCAYNFTDMGGYEDILTKWFEDRKIPSTRRNYATLPPDLLYTYAAADTDVCLRLYNLFANQLKQQNLEEFYNKLILPTSTTLMEMEYRGVLLDVNYQKFAEENLSIEISKQDKELRQLLQSSYKIVLPEDFKWTSNDQLAELLYEKLKMKIPAYTETGKPKCDEETLTLLAQTHEIPKKIVEYKKLIGYLTKYVRGLIERVDANGVLHTTFLLHGTVTGRLSSADPNLQNIVKHPVMANGHELKIKRMFIPRPGYKWIELDYGQAEFRHWANFSNDQEMIKDIIAADKGLAPDIHKKTAALAWKIPVEQVTKALRDKAKSCVFGLMYGRTTESVAEEVNCSIAEAEEIRRGFFSRYPTAKIWLDKAVQTVRTYGQIRNTFGRIRRIPSIRSTVEMVRSEAERLAKNSAIQSAASDMNCNAANRIRLAFKNEKIDGHLLILVHDAIYAEVAEKDATRALLLMRREMERPVSGINVPMRSEAKCGINWADATDVKFEELNIKENT